MIKFYDTPDLDSPKFLLKDKDASIQYSHLVADYHYTHFVAKDFVGYWKKISYEFLNYGDFSNKLNNYINNLIENGINKTIILYDEKLGYTIRIVPNKLKAAVVYQAEFEDFNNLPFSLVTLKRTPGGEAFYAHKSVLIFFDYIINKLSIHPYRHLDKFLMDVKGLYKNNLEDYLGRPST